MITPESVVETIDLVRERFERAAPFFVRGGGTRLRAVSEHASDGISTSNLNKLLFFDPDDMVVGVEAGMTYKQLHGILAEEGMQLAVNPWFSGATIGGMTAAGDYGPERMMGGGLRDSIIGMEVIDGRGLPFKAGGRVVKNVTGYDLSRMMIGSLGGLGLITSVNFKVTPAWEQARMIYMTCEDLRWVAWTRRIQLAKTPLDGFRAIYREGVWHLHLSFSGNDRRLARISTDLARLCDDHDFEIREAALIQPDGFLTPTVPEACQLHIHGRFTTECLLQESRLQDLARAGTCLVCHSIGGDFHLFSDHEPEDTLSRVEQICRNVHGYMEIVHHSAKEIGPLLRPQPPEWPLVIGLQKALDPKGIMRPDYRVVCSG